MKKIGVLIVVVIMLQLNSCSENKDDFRYNGRAETHITKIAAKTAGTIEQIACEEGDAVTKGQLLIKTDTDKLNLQLQQQEAQARELDANLLSIAAQIRQVKSQLSLAEQTLEKTKKMVSDGAATRQQQDELETQVEVLNAQLESIATNRQVVAAKKDQLTAAIGLTNLTIGEATLYAPFNGIIINKFLEETELVAPGRTILEIADLSRMEVTFYAGLEDLKHIKLGQSVSVHVDGTESILDGKVKWIANESEFTPKTILTKETRTTLVYAVKISVPNPDNILKIGMPVEVSLQYSE